MPPHAKNLENTTTMLIVRGNRQARRRLIKASKRFIIDADTYRVQPGATLMRVIDGRLQACCYYSEGNPEPWDFRQPGRHNDGIPVKEFNRLYGEDLYDMLVKIQSDKRGVYLLLLYIGVLITSVLTLTTCFI
jgi:hypothetical protein